MSRRKYLLNYFGEDYDENNGLGNKMDDNSIDIKEKKDIKFNVSKVLSCIKELKENYKLKELANYITGIETTLIRSHKLFESELFGFGKSEGVVFWKSVLRKMVVEKLLVKNIESYGILKISDSGHEFINQPYSIMMSIDNDFSVFDIGPYNDRSVDYPDYAKKLGNRIKLKKSNVGNLICGSGTGMAISANKIKPIRAAVCYNLKSTRLSRQHNNANIIALGSRLTNKAISLKLVEIFLKTKFEGGRHLRRIKKI